ncbi:unnamed protein product [Oikopleura dioica]|uniref:Uncharacterized protein n=1 Tax=Oikopleura dioica TaxID=34765 RepID=E4YKF2_OIKDI|nr:unnamed protein product [Oikopleura dioica]
MSQSKGTISGGTVSKIIKDPTLGNIQTKALGQSGFQQNIPTKASGFAQSYDIDVEVETTQTIHITNVQIIQSEVSIVES